MDKHERTNTMTKTFLHVGCGAAYKDGTTEGFSGSDWDELRLDIDANVKPDILSTMLDMSVVAACAVDALYSSHNIEHLYWHEVPVALAEFKRVLKDDGFAVITCPDLQSVCALIAQDKLTDTAYVSPAGPIAPLDILYGYRPSMARGNLYMAHRCGFTQKVLTEALQAAGFASVATMRRGYPSFDLYAVATKNMASESELRALAAAHFPAGNRLLEASSDDPDIQSFTTASVSSIVPLEVIVQRAVACHQAGQLQQAEEGYRSILQEHPNYPEINHNMGMLLVQMQQPVAGLPYLIKALEADPASGQYWISYIDALYQAGHGAEAKEVLNMARQQGLQGEQIDAMAAKIEGAAAPFSARSASQQPPEKQAKQLTELFGAGRHREAEKLARSMTADYPGYGFGWKVLGAVTASSSDALVPLQHAASLLPNDFEVHYNLGLVQQELGLLEEAASSYRRALQINPAYAQGHNNLGVTLQQLGRLSEAEASYREAIANDPDYVNAYYNLGIVLQALGRPAEAEAIHRQTLALNPEHAGAHCNLGTVLLGGGQRDAAIESFRRAIQIKPDFVIAHNNLILSQDMDDRLSLSELQAERRSWADAHAEPLWQQRVYDNDCTPGRRLRIGYVSADFREHSASKVFGGMLTEYDRSKFEVYAYSNSMISDDYTELFRSRVTAWRSIAGVSDQAAASMILDDRIDILVDLSGHTAGNRLLVFARKPAPLQVTALGYAAGTGMRAMDAFFTDSVMVPADEQRYYRERIRYLPCALSLFSMDEFPEINALPAQHSGIVTFGSFNRLGKASAETWRSWAEILQAVPGSRLLLKTGEFDDAEVRARTAAHFVAQGIAAERVVMLGKTSWQEHMRTYHSVDIALDPFPHGGGVTALEGLMMGVPMVTRCWPTLTGRISASVMTTLGLSDWIAQSQPQYVGLAVQKAGDLQSLAALRATLRARMNASVLGDTAAFVRAVEQEYLALWQQWCRARGE